MRLILVIALSMNLSWLVGQSTSSFPMKSQSVSNAMKQSNLEGKLLFIYFHADWVQPCQWMKTVTFKNKEITQFFNDHALFLELDIEKRIGSAEKQYFKVNSLPTMILFDASGNQLIRMEEAMEAKKLLSILQTWNLEENKKKKVGNVSEVSASNSLQHLNRAPLIPSLDFENIKESEISTFGVLVQLFHRYDSALEFSQQFQKKVEKKVTIIEHKLAKDLYQYQIVVSKFSNREEARAFLPHLRMMGINGEIIKL